LRVLTEAEDLGQLIHHFEKGQEETITIAVDAITNLNALTPVLCKLQTGFPETRVVLRPEVLSGAIEAVKTGTAAIAVSPMSSVMLEEEGFDYIPLGTSTLRNVTSPSLWAEMDNPKRLADLRRFHQVIASDSGQAGGLFDREIGVQKGQRRWYVSDLQTKKHLLIAGLGWGRLPEHMIAEELKQGRLYEIDLPHTHLAFDVTIYAFRQSKPIVRAVAALLWKEFEAQAM
jgi:DNA-binding transcriptional LysR family regulator